MRQLAPTGRDRPLKIRSSRSAARAFAHPAPSRRQANPPASRGSQEHSLAIPSRPEAGVSGAWVAWLIARSDSELRRLCQCQIVDLVGCLRERDIAVLGNQDGVRMAESPNFG